MSNAVCVFGRIPAVVGCSGEELCAHTGRGARVAEEHCPECNMGRAGCNQLESVDSCLYTAHADNRHAGREVTRCDRGERDRLQCRTGKAALAGTEYRS